MKNYDFLSKLLRGDSYFNFGFSNTIAKDTSGCIIELVITNRSDSNDEDQSRLQIMLAFHAKTPNSTSMSIAEPIAFQNNNKILYEDLEKKVGVNSKNSELEYLFSPVDVYTWCFYHDFDENIISDKIVTEYHRLVEIVKWLLTQEKFKDFKLVE